jgi:RNA 3'-phosphate cyclase
MIEIDGSHLEGGGQILRAAVALSAVTGKSVHVFNIRKGRDRPGLRPQHLHSIAAAGQICDAEIKGLVMDSTDIRFVPKMIRGGTHHIDTRTAGSVTLILQTLVPIGLSANAPLQLWIKGGTDVPFSPPIGYFLHVLYPALQRIGALLEVEVRRHGFYPRGGGLVFIRIFPSDLKPLRMIDRGSFKEVRMWVFASQHLKTARVAERISTGFLNVVKDAEVACTYGDAHSPGCVVTASARYDNGMLGASRLGEKGKPAERVGLEAANELKASIDSKAAVDNWMTDQLIPFMALATDRSGECSDIRIPSLTKHAQTNIWVVQKFLDVAFCTENDVLRCKKHICKE